MVDILGEVLARSRIDPVARADGGIDLVHVCHQPGTLPAGDLPLLGFDPAESSQAGHVETAISRVEAILLEHVST